MTDPAGRQAGGTTPLFRWDGVYWGFLQDNQLYDRYGHHIGWLDATSGADVYDLSGRFMGELWERHYVLRSVLRTEPIHRAPHAPVPNPTPPAPPPDRDPCDPRDGWIDALPSPLRPPDPPRR